MLFHAVSTEKGRLVSKALGAAVGISRDWLWADPVEQEACWVKSLSGPSASITLLPFFSPTMISGCSLATMVEGE